jgi:hypothetical protein
VTLDSRRSRTLSTRWAQSSKLAMRVRFPSPAQYVLLVDGLPSVACGRLTLGRWPPDPRHFPGVSARQGVQIATGMHLPGPSRRVGAGRFLASQGLYTPAHFWSMIDLFAVIT